MNRPTTHLRTTPKPSRSTGIPTLLPLHHKRVSALRPLCRALFRTAASLILLILLSCDDVSCPLNNTVTSVYNFYASARDEAGIFHEGASVSVADSITIEAVGAEDLLVNRDYNIATLSLPVSFYAPADTLIWKFADAQGRHAYDTLTIHKTNRHHFDDPSCPAHMWHHIDSIHFTRNVIDTIIVATPDINYDGAENFQIYFRTSTGDEETNDETSDDETNDETNDENNDETNDENSDDENNDENSDEDNNGSSDESNGETNSDEGNGDNNSSETNGETNEGSSEGNNETNEGNGEGSSENNNEANNGETNNNQANS